MKLIRKILGILPIASFIVSLVVIGLIYGALAYRNHYFPVPELKSVYHKLDDVSVFLGLKRHGAISVEGDGSTTRLLNADKAAPGLVAVVEMSEDLVNVARVVDRDGNTIHEWRLDWFELPTKDFHLPDNRTPVAEPGMIVHGAAVLDNGDIAFNFEHGATVRVDACGKARWVLKNLGHHSLEVDESGNIWVSAERFVPAGDETGFANHRAPLRDWMVEEISPDGKILRSFSVIDVLTKNDLLGLLYMSNIENRTSDVTGDTLHLNDVEVFPSYLPEGVFHHGDIMISLRNINAVLVLDPETLKVRYWTVGPFLRQHDPDFDSGDRIVVFDNRNLDPDPAPLERRSRLVEIDAAHNTFSEVYKSDNPEGRFFTSIMGKHQELPNGNSLITSSWEGRAMEITPEGELVWEYINALGDDYRGIVTQAILLPPEMDAQFFEKLQRACQ